MPAPTPQQLQQEREVAAEAADQLQVAWQEAHQLHLAWAIFNTDLGTDIADFMHFLFIFLCLVPAQGSF